MLSAFFQRVDAADHRKQVDRTTAVLAENLAAPAETPKRSVGRPKRARTVEEVLRAAMLADEQARKAHADEP